MVFVKWKVFTQILNLKPIQSFYVQNLSENFQLKSKEKYLRYTSQFKLVF